MATKAELEAELAALKQQMTEQAAPEAQEAAQDPAPEVDGDQGLAAALGALKSGDFAGLAGQLEHELKDLSLSKPVMTALGAFALGFMVGRARE
jgi:hypothetical protein